MDKIDNPAAASPLEATSAPMNFGPVASNELWPPSPPTHTRTNIGDNSDQHTGGAIILTSRKEKREQQQQLPQVPIHLESRDRALVFGATLAPTTVIRALPP